MPDAPLSPAPPYLSGLRLAGRRVVVLGGGAVAERRLVALLVAGAVVRVVAPDVTEAIRRYAEDGAIRWADRPYAAGDLEGAWYVLVATTDEACNQAASVEAEERRVFCVRADDASQGTAWTPASGTADGLTVGVLAGRNPARAKRVRDRLLRLVADEGC